MQSTKSHFRDIRDFHELSQDKISTDSFTLDSSLLVKYDEPVEIGEADTYANEWEEKQPAPNPKFEICDDAFTHSDEMEDVLNAIVPPAIWEDDGKIWKQVLSRSVGTRLEAINLQHNLDRLLKERQALNHGLCPVRRELYSHCFDEIIRQVTLDNPSRGLLLLRLRDEIQMTLAAYHILYVSAVAHGRESADSGYYKKLELLETIDDLEGNTESSRDEVKNLRLDVDHARRRLRERREMDGKRFAEEVQFIKRANQQLKQEIESLMDYGKRPSATLA